MSKSPVSICGPYPNRNKWRLVLLSASGRKSIVLPSREEADGVKARLLEEARLRPGKTIGDTLEEYRDYRIQYRGVLPQTAQEHCRHLQDMLPLHWPISSLTTEKARRLYLDYSNRPNKRNGKPLSPNTHHWVLLIAKCWAKWCVKTGILTSSPFAAVEPVGKGKAGKPQLRVDEAQRLNRLLIERSQAGDFAAVGVLLMLHLGLRQGEVSARVVRDVDADGGILVIPFGKTEGSRRRLKIPEWLRPCLLPLILDKAPSALLFSWEGRIHGKGYWWRKVHEYCAQAQVPLVCPHSLNRQSEKIRREIGYLQISGNALGKPNCNVQRTRF